MTKSILRAALLVAAISTGIVRAAIPSAENLLPTDTIAFVTVPDCATLRAVSKVSPQLMFWNDPAMKPFHDKFMAKLTEKFIAPLEKDLGLKTEDFASLPQGQFTFAVTVNGSNGRDEIPPGFVLLMDAKDKSAQLKTNLTALTKKITDQGRTVRTEKIRGMEFSVVTLSTNDLENIFGPRRQVSEIGKEEKPQQPVDIYYTQFESLLIAANSAKLAETVAARLTGGSVPALVDDPVFAGDKLSQFRENPTYYGWFNGKVFFNLLAQAQKDSAEASGVMPPIPADKILAATGLNNLKSVSFAVRESREGSTANFHITAPADTRAGLLKILSLPAKDSSPPAFVPADVVKFTRFRLDGRQAWADLEKMFANVSPQALAGINSAIDLANVSAQQKDPAFDLRKNLIGNLGDDIITYDKAPLGDSVAAINKQPTLTLIATPNAEQMIQAFKVLAGLVAVQDASTAPREFRGRKIYSIAQRPQRNASGGSVTPPPMLLSAASGYLAMTTDPGILEEFLRRTEDSGKSLRDNPGMIEAAPRVGGMATGMFSYQNQRETMRMSFKMFKSAAESDLASKLISPVVREWADFSLLPEYDRVSKYFWLSVLTGSANGDGLNLKIFTPRPPGLE